jgi:hypothetical protein
VPIERRVDAPKVECDPAVLHLLETTLSKYVTPSALHRVQQTLESHDLDTLCLLRSLGADSWERIRVEAGLTFGLMERVKCAVALTMAVATSATAGPGSPNSKIASALASAGSGSGSRGSVVTQEEDESPLPRCPGLRLFCRGVSRTMGYELLFPFQTHSQFFATVAFAKPGPVLKEDLIAMLTLNSTVLSLLLGGLLGIAGTVNLEAKNTFDQIYLCVLGISTTTCLASLLLAVFLIPLTQAVSDANMRVFFLAHLDAYHVSQLFYNANIYCFFTSVLLMMIDLSPDEFGSGSSFNAIHVCLISFIPVPIAFKAAFVGGIAGRSAAHSGALAEGSIMPSNGKQLSRSSARAFMLRKALANESLCDVYKLAPDAVENEGDLIHLFGEGMGQLGGLLGVPSFRSNSKSIAKSTKIVETTTSGVQSRAL